MKKILACLTIASLLAFSFPLPLDSANLTSASDTLSSSRLSYYNSLANTHSAGSSLVTVNNSTANLFNNDIVWIGDGSTGSTYTVKDIINNTRFSLTSGLDANDIDQNDLVIATRSAVHTVSFTPATSITNGAIRVLIPAGTNNSNDGIPNHDGFDFGVNAPSLTGPSGGGVGSWETPTATPSGGTGCASGYHCFEARYNGTNNTSNALNFIIGGANKLINPSRASGSAGSAQTYTVIIQHLGPMTNQYPVIDSTTIKIAVVESIRVTATVDPTINFTISGVAASQTKCNVSTSVETSAASVPLGVLAIDSFTNAAQNLKTSTNAVGGYVVTALASQPLTMVGGTTKIPDTSGNGNATEDAWDEWTSTNNKGFGYSIQNNDAFDVTFTYASASSQCSGGNDAFCARRFPALSEAESVRQLFYSTTVADSEDVDVCYRAVISSTQAAGNYQNSLTYTATAIF